MRALIKPQISSLSKQNENPWMAADLYRLIGGRSELRLLTDDGLSVLERGRLKRCM